MWSVKCPNFNGQDCRLGVGVRVRVRVRGTEGIGIGECKDYGQDQGRRKYHVTIRCTSQWFILTKKNAKSSSSSSDGYFEVCILTH